MIDDEVERVARAFFEVDVEEGGWLPASPAIKRNYRLLAQAAIAALDRSTIDDADLQLMPFIDGGRDL
jgi:hypothetical protein